MFLVPTLALSASVNQASQSGVKLSCVLPQRIASLFGLEALAAISSA